MLPIVSLVLLNAGSLWSTATIVVSGGYVRSLCVTCSKYTDPIGASHDFLWGLLHTVAKRNVVPMRFYTKTVDMSVNIFSRVIGANLYKKQKTC